MPTYEFTCKKCNKMFTLLLRLAEYEKGGFKCPECNSRKVKQQISTFQTKTSRKSWQQIVPVHIANSLGPIPFSHSSVMPILLDLNLETLLTQ